MKILKSKIGLLALFLFLISVSIGVYLFFFKQSESNMKSEFVEVAAENISDLQFEELENKRIIATYYKDSKRQDRPNVSISQNTIYNQSRRINTSKEYSNDFRQNKGEYYYLYTYDLATKQHKKKLDIFDIIKRYNPNVGIDVPGEVIYFQGTDYFHVRLTKENTGVYLKDVLINMETEEVIDYPKELNDYIQQFNDAKKVTGLDNLLWDTYKTYIHYSYLSNLGQEHMEIPSTLNIAKMYPDLVKKMNDNKVSILVRQGENSQEEWFDILMSWFAPVGEEKLSLSAIDKGTGETTPIASYQDYLTWRTTHQKKEVSNE